MMTSAYERALFGHSANENARPPKPNVIALAIKAVGKWRYRGDARGHWVRDEAGAWCGPLKLPEFIRHANGVLKAQGKAQIDVNPSWRV